MGPSAYHAELAKDQEIENRDGVRVVFVGGNSFHLFVGDDPEPVKVRGVNKAYKRAEWHRSDLNPDYVEPVEPEVKPAAPADDDTPPWETDGADSKIPEAEAESVSYNGVEGRLALVDVSTVQQLLGDSQGRVDLLRGSGETRRLHSRVRATDGRCAPIVLTQGDAGEFPVLFDGLSTLAASLNLGMERVAVVIMPQDRVQDAQGVIAAMRVAALAPVNKTDDEDEDLIYRANMDD